MSRPKRTSQMMNELLVNSGYLKKGEKVFILRGQDKLSVKTMEHWLDLYETEDGHSEEVANMVGADIKAMQQWQEANEALVKLAD